MTFHLDPNTGEFIIPEQVFWILLPIIIIAGIIIIIIVVRRNRNEVDDNSSGNVTGNTEKEETEEERKSREERERRERELAERATAHQNCLNGCNSRRTRIGRAVCKFVCNVRFMLS